jgi:uridine kinase
MHQQFIEPTKAFADIIPNDRYNTVAIDVVRAVINQKFYNFIVILSHGKFKETIDYYRK